jgi:hypothetical protein
VFVFHNDLKEGDSLLPLLFCHFALEFMIKKSPKNEDWE